MQIFAKLLEKVLIDQMNQCERSNAMLQIG